MGKRPRLSKIIISESTVETIIELMPLLIIIIAVMVGIWLSRP